MSKYSEDFRLKALDLYFKEGYSSVKICSLLKISRISLLKWRKQYLSEGNVKSKKYSRLPNKLDENKLYNLLESKPDATLKELAADLGMSFQGVFHALKRLKITRKKRVHIIKKDRKKSVKII